MHQSCPRNSIFIPKTYTASLFNAWLAVLFMAAFSFSSCVSLTQSDDEPPPEISSELTDQQLINYSVDYGGDILLKAKGVIDSRNSWDAVASHIEKNMNTFLKDFNDLELINLMYLYQSCRSQKAHFVVRDLIASNKKIAIKLAWILATKIPTPKMAAAVEIILSKALVKGNWRYLISPELATAIEANGLHGSYSFVREGLFMDGHPSFARAMIRIKKDDAAADLLRYLAASPLEDLRQLNPKEIDPATATLILEFFIASPPDIFIPGVSHLFLYSISRNRLLASTATKVLEELFKKNSYHMAVLLSEFDSTVQLAFLGNAQRNMSHSLRVFTNNLKKISAKPEVIKEIDAMRF